MLIRQHDFLKDRLTLSEEKYEKPDKDQMTLAQDMSNKTLDKNELTLQNSIIYGFKRTKLASMIYVVSKSKGEGLGYYQKHYNPRINVLVKPPNPSSSSYAQTMHT